MPAISSSSKYDVIVIGGGHNGLTNAAYLAKAGKKVLVLERRHILGGAACTEEVFPGFKFSVCSYVVSLLRPEIIRDLDLPRHGLEILPLDGTFTPMPNGDHLWRVNDHGKTHREIARHSRVDAEAYDEFGKAMQAMCRFVKPILGMIPPDPATLSDLETLPFKSGGKPRLALLADFGHSDDRIEDFALLMVFDDAGRTPRLLDSGFVGVDKDTAFSEHPLIALGPGDDAIVTYSEHFNSEQTYGGWMVSFLHGRRLRMVAVEQLLSDRGCGYERNETPAFTTRAVPGSPYRELDITVTDEVTHNDDGCGDENAPNVSKHIYRDSWRWNARAGRFRQRLNGVDRLDKKNEARF